MNDAVWSLWVRGRLTTRISLTDGGEDALAEISMRRRFRSDVIDADVEGRDGARWAVRLTGALDVEVREGDAEGPVVVTADAERLRVGDRDFAWSRRTDGSRRAKVVDERRRALLDIAPGDGRRDPWAIVAVDRQLPRPLPVALAACVLLLRVDAVIRPSPDLSSGGGA